MTSNRFLILGLFFLCGFASLIYQICWQRILTQMIGIDSYSITLIISLFMLGLGIGGLYGSKILRNNSNLFVTLALLEFFIGIFGFISVPLLRSINTIFLVGSSLQIQLFINFLILLFPTLLMGATTPLMVHSFRNRASSSEATGSVYASNIFGAAIGVLLCGFVLVGSFGFLRTTQMIAIVDFFISILFFIIGYKNYDLTVKKTIVTSLKSLIFLKYSGKTADKLFPLIIASSFFVGFVAIGYEIAYFRLFTSYFGVTPYTFPILLFAYLVNMAAGTYLGGIATKKFEKDKIFLLFVLGAIVFSLPILYLQEFFLKMDFFQPTFVFDPTRVLFDHNLIQLLASSILAVILMLPVTFISALFPIFVAVITEKKENLGKNFGLLYFFQTMGNTLGSLVTGFVFYLIFNTISILKILSGGLILASLLFLYGKHNSRTNRSLLLNDLKFKITTLLLCILFITIYNDQYYQSIHYYKTRTENYPPTLVKDTLHGMSLTYKKNPESYALLSGGRFYVTGIPGGKTLPYETFIGVQHIVYAINPSVKNVLFIGIGTAHEILIMQRLFPDSSIDLVEINPDVLQAILKLGHPLIVEATLKAKLFLMDGRRFLMHHANKKYDYIHIGVDKASTTGAGNLFSQDFLKLAKNYLKKDGMITFYGYPAVVKAAIEVFPEVTIFSQTNGIAQAICFNNAESFTKLSTDAFAERYDASIKKLTQDGKIASIDSLYKGGGFAGLLPKVSAVIDKKILRDLLQDVSPATDDLLITEYYLNNINEIVHGSFHSPGKALDIRNYPLVLGAKAFPWPKQAVGESFTKRTIFDWDRTKVKVSGILSQTIGDLQSINDKDQTQAHFSFDHYLTPFYWNPYKVKSEKNSFEWSVEGESLHQPIFNRMYLLEVTAKKTGRGIWGIKIKYQDQHNHWKDNQVWTASPKEETLRTAYYIPAGAKNLSFNIMYSDYLGFSFKSAFTIEKIKISSFVQQ